MKLKLQQGQMWKKGDLLLRIVHLERLSVGYKEVKNVETKEGEHHTVTKKEFCRLIKGAELLDTMTVHSSASRQLSRFE